jgi:hypothetical protein
MSTLSLELFQLSAAIGRGAGRIALVAAKRGEGEVKYRIFNTGYAANGARIGNGYSRRYQRIRRLAGAQTAYVDLQLTGTLNKSMEVVTSGQNAAILAITNPERAKVAAKLEQQYKKPIFALSTSEVNDVLEAAELEINAIINEWLLT